LFKVTVLERGGGNRAPIRLAYESPLSTHQRIWKDVCLVTHADIVSTAGARAAVQTGAAIVRVKAAGMRLFLTPVGDDLAEVNVVVDIDDLRVYRLKQHGKEQSNVHWVLLLI
jgi:hypothetical protein